MAENIIRIEELLIRQKNNKKIALIQSNKQISYKAWHEEALKLKMVLKQYESDYMKNIILFLPNSINYAIAYFAVLLNEQTVVPIGIQAKLPEILSTVQYCEADIVITNTEYYPFLSKVFEDYKWKIRLINIDSMEMSLLGSGDFIEKSNMNETQDNDIAVMLHTSGTTDNPKRVMLTHSNLLHNIESHIESLDLRERDISLMALPIFFGYCNTAQFLTHVYLGAQIIFFEGLFFPKLFFKLVEKYKVTNFIAVPSMLLMLFEYRYVEEYNITSLRYIIFGGGNMPVGQLKQIIQRFSTVGFVQTYGQTECSPRVTALLPEYALLKVGSVGKAIPGVSIKIVDKNGIEVKATESGEILVQGKNVMKGYYKRNSLTKNVIQNGWLHTGDIGCIDEDGFLYLKGRIKNIIITGGINVYPEEIEQVICQCDNVMDVLVYGEEDKLLGEIVVAKIVLESENGIEAVREYCKNNLAEYKVPKKFYIIEKIDKTYNGKVKRGHGE